jgi:hypothetical protein
MARSSSYSCNPAFQSLRKTPRATQCWNRRCSVLPEPKPRGTAFHWQPVRKT